MTDVQLMKDGRWRRSIPSFAVDDEQLKKVHEHAHTCEMEALKKIQIKLKELGHEFDIVDRSTARLTWVELKTPDASVKIDFVSGTDSYVGKLRLSMGGNYKLKLSGFRRQYKYDFETGEASPKFYEAVSEGLKALNSANKREKELDGQQKSAIESVETTLRNLKHEIVANWTSRIVAKLDPETPLETTVSFFVKGNTISVDLQLMTEAIDFPELLSVVRALNKRGNITTRYSG